ncbi:MAG: hypothetical protein ACHP84_04980 [Caulobacterales bacterium]
MKLLIALAPIWAALLIAGPAPAQTAAAPAASPTQAAPAAQPPAKPAAACKTAPFSQLAPLLSSEPFRSLTPSTAILPVGDEGVVDMVGSLGSSASVDDYQFRIFVGGEVANPARLNPRDTADGAGQDGLRPLAAAHPTGPAAQALKIADANNAYEIHFKVPSDGGWLPWRTSTYVIVACHDAQIVGWGSRPITESRSVPVEVLAAGLMLVFYLLAATMAYRARERARNESPAVQPPLRVERIDRWEWWRFLDPVVMTSDGFDRGSLSNLQVLFFVEVVGFGLTDLVLSTGALSDISPAIVYLLGIPAAGTLGNQVASVTRDRISAGNWSWLVSRGVLPINDPGKLRPQWSDLIMSDTVLDLPKLQALTFSVIVAIAMVAAGFRNFANFNVPTNLLEILGLSQLVFVGGRFTRPTNMGDLDVLITELRKRALTLITAAKSGVDVDGDGKPRAAPAGAARSFATLASAAAPQAVPNAVHRYAEVADQAKVLLGSLAHRAVEPGTLADPLAWPEPGAE